ncbi:MAG: hypothetical protein A2342_01895 [Gallionellales bacterium RIFOXYB12_FULL_54_9]|nr:MAG: hypothetical protein A2342_01895 [Gallionellales bacterium RIFOXYB12_FULL_54_9]
MSILTMNMSSYEIERIDVCAAEAGTGECTDGSPEVGLQQYASSLSCHVMMSIDPDVLLNRMDTYRQ